MNLTPAYNEVGCSVKCTRSGVCKVHKPEGRLFTYDTCVVRYLDGFQCHAVLDRQVAHEQHLAANSRLKQFTVHHYNHAVKYDADGFVERNRDKLHTSVAKLLGASTNNMVRRYDTTLVCRPFGPFYDSSNRLTFDAIRSKTKQIAPAIIVF